MQKNNSGQSLIETIVAFGILTTGIVAIMSLTASGLFNSGISRQRIVAINLAREGLEITRAIRDSRWLNPDTVDFLPAGKYKVDYNDNDLDNLVSNIVDCKLYQESGTQLFTHFNTGTETNFWRMITISAEMTGESNRQRKVESWVQWQDRGKTYNYELEEILTDWK
ncbi:MAG: hypothetical protein PHS07_02275 [Patescibacteria group bacterium]|nr:hypothetical protein [Patescibacteria group bacterium]